MQCSVFLICLHVCMLVGRDMTTDVLCDLWLMVCVCGCVLLAREKWLYGVEDIMECEFFVLEFLSFDLIVFHPYRPLVQFLSDINRVNECLPTAWAIVNDSYRTDLCLLYPPYLIAIAAVYMSCTFAEYSVSEWLTKLNVKLNDVLDITKTILELYDDYERKSAALNHSSAHANANANSNSNANGGGSSAAAAAASADVKMSDVKSNGSNSVGSATGTNTPGTASALLSSTSTSSPYALPPEELLKRLDAHFQEKRKLALAASAAQAAQVQAAQAAAAAKQQQQQSMALIRHSSASSGGGGGGGGGRGGGGQAINYGLGPVASNASGAAGTVIPYDPHSVAPPPQLAFNQLQQPLYPMMHAEMSRSNAAASNAAASNVSATSIPTGPQTAASTAAFQLARLQQQQAIAAATQQQLQVQQQLVIQHLHQQQQMQHQQQNQHHNYQYRPHQ